MAEIEIFGKRIKGTKIKIEEGIIYVDNYTYLMEDLKVDGAIYGDSVVYVIDGKETYENEILVVVDDNPVVIK